jgi:protein SCO1/2
MRGRASHLGALLSRALSPSLPPPGRALRQVLGGSPPSLVSVERWISARPCRSGAEMFAAGFLGRARFFSSDASAATQGGPKPPAPAAAGTAGGEGGGDGQPGKSEQADAGKAVAVAHTFSGECDGRWTWSPSGIAVPAAGMALALLVRALSLKGVPASRGGLFAAAVDLQERARTGAIGHRRAALDRDVRQPKRHAPPASGTRRRPGSPPRRRAHRRYRPAPRCRRCGQESENG